MKIWQCGTTAGAGGLRLVEEPAPAPGPLDVVVAVRAVALNYRDLLVTRGDYHRGVVPVGAVPCSDMAGEVTAVGDGVTSVRLGDRVTSHFAPDWQQGRITRKAVRTTLGSGSGPGVLAECVVLHEHAVMAMPAGMTFEQASTLPCAALTAWHALFEEGAFGPGATVVTLGAGGVSTFAVQMAHAVGARVIATTSTAVKAERLREVVNYREHPEWGERVRDLAGGEGADLVIEVGGQGTLGESSRAVRPGGTIALIGTLAGPAPLNLAPIFLRNIRVQGVTVGSREMFERMNLAVDAWRLEPVIDRTFPFEAAPDAFEHLAAGRHVGKVVIHVSH
jgi:NADPH:quinone reductase-like Zn-dependent oxidoreductase